MFTRTRLRKLEAERARRSKKARRATSRIGLDQPGVRDRIAEAVHHAVCDFTGSDGFGLCMLYAVAGSGLLGRAFGEKFYPQAGSMAVLADKPDVWVTMDASNFATGEFHCWLGRPMGGDRVELIDFTARHYRDYCDRLIDVTGFDHAEPSLFVRSEGASEGHRRPTWSRGSGTLSTVRVTITKTRP